MTTETVPVPDTKPSLTEQQARVLQFITDNAAMYSPTVREIAAAFGFKSPNGVTCHLVALERKGYLKRHRTVRGIEVLR
jgi:repressor LexA